MNNSSANRSVGAPIAPALLLACAAVIAGCATAPNADLERARASYQAAAQDPDVSRYASVSLYEAKKDLDRAEAEYAGDNDEAETSHLARMSEARVNIARANAETGRARADTQQLFETREKLQLEARTAQMSAAEARAREAEKALADLQAERTSRGIVLNFAGDVLFDVNQSVISPGARSSLDRVAAFLRENPKREVVVEGHTDSTGSDEYNMALSQRRADAVGNYLISGGISGTRIVTRGYGETVPVASNDNAAGRQQNRRVSILILNEGEKASGSAPGRPGAM